MLARLVRPFLGGRRLYPLYRRMYALSLRGMNIGLGGNVKSSGEINVLKYVKAHCSNNPIIFDVGANKGQYTKSLLEFFHEGSAEVHCFEPGHQTFRELTQELKGRKNVKLNNFGLSNENSEGVLYYDAAGSGLASLYKRQLDYFNIEFEQSENVALKRLDDYVSENTITQIDLLKLDVEGNELNVLVGAAEALSNGIIRTIQIEFGGCNIDSRTFIRDFWNLLHQDFVMYRIMTNGLIEIKNYMETLEVFSCTNFFFAKR